MKRKNCHYQQICPNTPPISLIAKRDGGDLKKAFWSSFMKKADPRGVVRGGEGADLEKAVHY